MNPILYEANSTSFDGMGLGVLSDSISCLVTEERNGIYEVEMQYPITGIHFAEISKGRIIRVSHDEVQDLQPFVIYHISKPINGVCTINARHISYDLQNIIVSPYEASSIGTAFSGFQTYAMMANPFTFWTDKTSAGTFAVKVPTSIRALLGGSEGSILDAFGGGEYEFTDFTVKLYQNRGSNNGVEITYGKNLTDLTADIDAESLYNAVIPYWSDGASVVVYGGIVTGNGGIQQVATWTDENGLPMQDENGSIFDFHTYLSKVVPMDLSDEFDEEPTVNQLQTRAAAILNNNEPWIPKVNIKVDFVALWQTEEYKNIAPLERVKLCDTVHVKYAALGVDATAKVIRVVWNALTERYDEIELGDAKTSFADTIMAETDSKIKDMPSNSEMDKAIENATKQITGATGGYIVLNQNANGKPYEQLIMDTDDKNTAVNVWRWNLGGLGHSHSGYNGPFDDIALTQNGEINASMITVGSLNAAIITTGTLNVDVIGSNSVTVDKLTGQITNGNWNINLTDGTLTIGNISAANITSGTMSAARISGGTLTLGGATDGKMEVYNSSNVLIGSFSKTGITIENGTIKATDGSKTSMIDGGYTKYYYGSTYIGNIGANIANSEEGLVFDLKADGDYIGWFLNGVNNPILIYDKSDWLSQDIPADTITTLRDLHVDDNHVFYGRISNPSWKFSGTNYAGYTGNVTINNVQMTFKNGVLTAAANV